MTRKMWLGCTVALMALPLVGCSAAKSLINGNIPAISNLLKLDGQTLACTMGSGRAVISGHKSVTVSFANQSIDQASQLGKIAFAQSVNASVTVSVPSGATMPTNFPLSNVTLSIVVREGSGSGAISVPLTATVAGPVTFTRTGTTNVYTASGPLVFSTDATGTSLTQVVAIITGGIDPNSVDANLSVDSDDTKLPSGSVITFTLSDGSGKPQL